MSAFMGLQSSQYPLIQELNKSKINFEKKKLNELKFTENLSTYLDISKQTYFLNQSIIFSAYLKKERKVNVYDPQLLKTSCEKAYNTLRQDILNFVQCDFTKYQIKMIKLFLDNQQLNSGQIQA